MRGRGWIREHGTSALDEIELAERPDADPDGEQAAHGDSDRRDGVGLDVRQAWRALMRSRRNRLCAQRNSVDHTHNPSSSGGMVSGPGSTAP
jgi:hypothetical protein